MCVTISFEVDINRFRGKIASPLVHNTNVVLEFGSYVAKVSVHQGRHRHWEVSLEIIHDAWFDQTDQSIGIIGNPFIAIW